MDGVIGLVINLAVYIFFGYCLMVIAQKTNTDNGWMAFIPIINLILLIQIAGRPIWWIILFLIPLVNIVIFVLVGMDIAKARNKPAWVGVLLIIPLANLIALPYLAFSD